MPVVEREETLIGRADRVRLQSGALCGHRGHMPDRRSVVQDQKSAGHRYFLHAGAPSVKRPLAGARESADPACGCHRKFKREWTAAVTPTPRWRGYACR